MIEPIKIRGLRQNNLKNISLDIPKNKIVVFTGVSGSGKSSISRQKEFRIVLQNPCWTPVKNITPIPKM